MSDNVVLPRGGQSPWECAVNSVYFRGLGAAKIASGISEKLSTKDTKNVKKEYLNYETREIHERKKLKYLLIFAFSACFVVNQPPFSGCIMVFVSFADNYSGSLVPSFHHSNFPWDANEAMF